MRAWQAVLASFLFFAPSVTNAETIQISDDRGGLVIAYQMHWAMLAPENVNVQIAGPCVSACTILLGYIPRGRGYCRRFKGLARVPFGHPRLCHARFVERLSIGHPLVDCTARRFNPSNYLATSARYLRIFS